VNASYSNGALVIYTDENSGMSAEGIVLSFNAEQQYVLLVKDPDGDWDVVRAEPTEVAANLGDDPLTFPGKHPAVTADNIFVVQCEAEDGPNFELFATPTAVEAAHPEVEDLRIRLMEAIADPGEKFEMDGTYYVTFRSVQGDLSK